VDGTTGVVDSGAVRGMGGVDGVAWTTAKVVDAARGAAEVSEAGDKGTAQGLAV
jgi:hypothetical protein